MLSQRWSGQKISDRNLAPAIIQIPAIDFLFVLFWLLPDNGK